MTVYTIAADKGAVTRQWHNVPPEDVLAITREATAWMGVSDEGIPCDCGEWLDGRLRIAVEAEVNEYDTEVS